MMRPDSTNTAPCAIVAMGVSGSGKSTLAECLATRLDCAFLEGDAFHGAANVAKMRAGHPLTDDDRWPWLDRLGAAIGTGARDGGIVVATCSALKRTYRRRLESAAALPLLFVLLDGDVDALAARMERRAGHYMPASLLDSQIATLERPTPDERALTLDAVRPQDALCDAALAWIDEMRGALPR
ncbi:gluconokinase [Sphingomonas arantia]|uniref:Gluconokinase n=1 Tax=Sphingomonas arantia TaxID=1460676 RepID=A0ABW4TW26_9SPHN